MSRTTANWAQRSVTTATQLTTGNKNPKSVKCLIINNDNASARTVDVDIRDAAGNVVAEIMTDVSVANASPQVVDLHDLPLAIGNNIWVAASGADVDFFAGGEELTR